jgi:divinyl chlorophyllide a 8-vinyl-reductase
MSISPRTVLLLGATGTIGRATAGALEEAGHTVVAPVRSGADAAHLARPVRCDFTNTSLTDLMKDNCCDAVISCLASRTGSPSDARAIDRDLNATVLDAARAAGIAQFVLLSAICVQKPQLAFQQAKLEFEQQLQAAGLTWSIVRPTAFFKSLSGQLGRVRKGKPFLLFGNGELTACKPISDADLAGYLVACLHDKSLHNRILPIGGPGPALTPRQQGELLFAALGQPPKFRQVPVGLMSAIIAGLSFAGRLSPGFREKAELARIGRYYATESMLVWDAANARYDADATPETGTDTLADHYRKLVSGDAKDDRGAHAVF